MIYNFKKIPLNYRMKYLNSCIENKLNGILKFILLDNFKLLKRKEIINIINYILQEKELLLAEIVYEQSEKTKKYNKEIQKLIPFIMLKKLEGDKE